MSQEKNKYLAKVWGFLQKTFYNVVLNALSVDKKLMENILEGALNV